MIKLQMMGKKNPLFFSINWKIWILFFLFLSNSFYCTPLIVDSKEDQVVKSTIDSSSNPNESIIFVSKGVIIYDETKDNAVIAKHKQERKSLNSKKKKSKVFTKPKIEHKSISNPNKSLLVFSEIPSDENLNTNYYLNNKNSFGNQSSFGKKMVSCQYRKLSLPLFAYLIKIYTVEFSITATLSQYIFSRPPPYIV